MKLPSISYILKTANKSLIRFPLTVISAIVITVLSIYLIENVDNIENVFPLLNICLTFGLGISLYLAVSLYAEKNKVNTKVKWGSFFLATVVLVLIHNTLPGSEAEASKVAPYINFTIYSIISHLLVAFLPYFRSKQENGFWNYNKGLFIRFATTYLYSIILFAGLALSLVSLNLLFDVDFDDELFGDLWMLIAILFSTWFFISGIPENLDELENDIDYPKGLKTFGQYILLPLVIIYSVILYAYGAKIVFAWDWPKGIVTYMISVYSVLGILAFLLLYPWGNLEKTTWVKKFSRLFYILMLPLVVLLFLAVSIRVSEYGITINRYLVIVIGIWISIVSLYFSLGKTNIKFVPMSLSAILIMMMVGPWGMFSVSERSQSSRLIELLDKNDLLVDGKIINEFKWEVDTLSNFIYADKFDNQRIIEYEDYKQVASIVEYLEDYHGFSSISHLFYQNIDSLIIAAKTKNRWLDEDRIIMNTLGLDNNIWNYNEIGKVVEVVLHQRYRISTDLDYKDIKGYDYLVSSNFASNDVSISSTFTFEGTVFEISLDTLTLKVRVGDEEFDLALEEHIGKLKNKYGNSDFLHYCYPDELTKVVEYKNFKIKLIFNDILTSQNSESYEIEELDMDIYIKKK